MARNKPGGESNLLALMRNHGSNKNKNKNKNTIRKNTVKTRKNEKKPSLKSQKSQKSQKNKTKASNQYDRKKREWAKRPVYTGDKSRLKVVREPWDARNDDEYYDREYYLDPKTGNYYDLDHLRLVGRTRNSVIIPLKLIR